MLNGAPLSRIANGSSAHVGIKTLWNYRFDVVIHVGKSAQASYAGTTQKMIAERKTKS